MIQVLDDIFEKQYYDELLFVLMVGSFHFVIILGYLIETKLSFLLFVVIGRMNE